MSSHWEDEYRCTGCKQIPYNCQLDGQCVGKSKEPRNGPVQNGVCANCRFVCSNLEEYGKDCFGFIGGVPNNDNYFKK